MEFPPKVKYVLVPGWVTSERDGERRYVSQQDLIRLYKPPTGSFMLVRDHPDVPTFLRKAQASGLVALHARADGDYTLPPPGKRIGVGVHDLSEHRGTSPGFPEGDDPPPTFRRRTKGK